MLQKIALVLLVAFVSVAAIDTLKYHPNGQLYKDHWEAAKLTLFQAEDRYKNAESTLWGIICDQSIGFDNGTLWKPVSEGRNKPYPVLLLPGAYLGAKIEVYHPTGFKVADGKDYGELLNGGRAHFGISKLASDLPFDMRLVIDRGQGLECLYIHDPRQRRE